MYNSSVVSLLTPAEQNFIDSRLHSHIALSARRMGFFLHGNCLSKEENCKKLAFFSSRL